MITLRMQLIDVVIKGKRIKPQGAGLREGFPDIMDVVKFSYIRIVDDEIQIIKYKIKPECLPINR